MQVLSPALRYLLEVAATGSITEASASLRVAASSISRQITRLEQQAGVPLFERHPGGMRPSPAGRLLIEAARRCRAEEERAEAAIAGLTDAARTTVRLAASEGFAAGLLPQVMARFRRAHPRTRFEVHVVEPATATELVREGTADVALTFSLAPQRDVEVLHSEVLPVSAVVADDHPLARRDALWLADLQPHPLALRRSPSTLRQLFDIACSLQQLSFEVAVSSDNPWLLLDVTRHGRLVTLAGRYSVTGPHATGLRLVPLRDEVLQQRVVQVQALAGRHPEPVVEEFVELLVGVLARE
ncbi:LysR family transcriptional regulator [Pseudonocardia sp. C8]|uniref:LysR family transcriptional regulator n=1 Tax=Pseudonocardia sp. C8 TaxID=2762759 RepID=UPI001642D8DC|nr:LysR family transcriptional regulator [Pseudonocardia sp. C8]MBC3191157.1 LysR family transcriptional regulator [Pseudonocardia sp. C8]